MTFNLIPDAFPDRSSDQSHLLKSLFIEKLNQITNNMHGENNQTWQCHHHRCDQGQTNASVSSSAIVGFGTMESADNALVATTFGPDGCYYGWSSTLEVDSLFGFGVEFSPCVVWDKRLVAPPYLEVSQSTTFLFSSYQSGYIVRRKRVLGCIF